MRSATAAQDQDGGRCVVQPRPREGEDGNLSLKRTTRHV
jgi:hypothetical protein